VPFYLPFENPHEVNKISPKSKTAFDSPPEKKKKKRKKKKEKGKIQFKIKPSTLDVHVTGEEGIRMGNEERSGGRRRCCSCCRRRCRERVVVVVP
jgi:hypothetical protein